MFSFRFHQPLHTQSRKCFTHFWTANTSKKKWSSRLKSHISILAWLWGQNTALTFLTGGVAEEENCTSAHLQGCPWSNGSRLAHTNCWSSWAFWGQRRKFQSLSSFAYVSQMLLKQSVYTCAFSHAAPRPHIDQQQHVLSFLQFLNANTDCSSALENRGSSYKAGGNQYVTTIILCSIITQNLHCWVGSLHWFLQKIFTAAGIQV